MERLLNIPYDFVQFSQALLEDKEVRNSFKFVCFELLHELIVIYDAI